MKNAEELIAGVLGISPQLLRDDTGYLSVPQWDSLRHIDLMLALEAETDSEISADVMVELINVAAIRAFLLDRAKRAGGS